MFWAFRERERGRKGGRERARERGRESARERGERESARARASERASEREDRLDLFEKVAHLAEAAAVLAHHVHVLVCMHPHHIVHVHASVKGLGLVVTH
jgi:hypothetical protein